MAGPIAIADNVREKLGKAVPLRVYKRPPLSKEIFSLSLDAKRKNLWIWQGTAKVKVYPNSKLKQAVVRVTEENRKITRSYSISLNKAYYDDFVTQADSGWVRDQAVDYFPVNIPGADYDDYTVESIGKFHASDFDPQWGAARVTVTVAAEDTDLTFLVGQDEKHLFVSALPEPATSVAQAHAILRPEDISENALRQGEWFFDPVTDPKIIKAAIHQAAIGYMNGLEELERGSNHEAPLVAGVGDTWNEKYTFGPVIDTSERHDPLILPGLCKVVRNREIQVENLESRNWD